MKNIRELLKAVVGENNVITSKVDRMAYVGDLTLLVETYLGRFS